MSPAVNKASGHPGDSGSFSELTLSQETLGRPSGPGHPSGGSEAAAQWHSGRCCLSSRWEGFLANVSVSAGHPTVMTSPDTLPEGAAQITPFQATGTETHTSGERKRRETRPLRADAGGPPESDRLGRMLLFKDE